MANNKIEITTKQAAQFNRMLLALKTISKEFSTPSQLREESEGEYGLDFEEAIEMAYENIQTYALFACKGIKEISFQK